MLGFGNADSGGADNARNGSDDFQVCQLRFIFLFLFGVCVQCWVLS